MHTAWGLCGVSSRYCGGSRHLNMISVRTHCSPVFRPGIGGRGGGNAGTGLAGDVMVSCLHSATEIMPCLHLTADYSLDGWSAGHLVGRDGR